MTIQAEVKTKLADLAELKQLASDAWDAHRREVDREAREAAERARLEVAERHKVETERLREARTAAHRAWQEELDASAAHEWEGRKVVRRAQVGPGYNRSVETTYGVVEVRRSDTRFPANAASYSLPSMGAPFVRLLKGDGTVGKKIETCWFSDWKLADDPPNTLEEDH